MQSAGQSPVKKFEKDVTEHLKTLKLTDGVEGDVCIWNRDETIAKLRKKYWRALANVDYLQYVINEKERVQQQTCDHIWEYEASRDDRTHYTCKNCGLFR